MIIVKTTSSKFMARRGEICEEGNGQFFPIDPFADKITINREKGIIANISVHKSINSLIWNSSDVNLNEVRTWEVMDHARDKTTVIFSPNLAELHSVLEEAIENNVKVDEPKEI
jgi:hypothetical protein